MKLQELIENPQAPAAPPNPSMADKALGGAAKVAGALNTASGIAGKINKFASSSREGGALAGVNTEQLRTALINVVNKKELTPQEIEVITQAHKTL